VHKKKPKVTSKIKTIKMVVKEEEDC